MRTAYYICLLFLVTCFGLLNSCVNESYTNCPTGGLGSLLHFSYKGDGQSEIFFKKISSVKIFVYNSANNLVSEKNIDTQQLNGEAKSLLDNLPAGQYRVVCWGNTGDKTAFKSVGSFNTAELSTPDIYERGQAQTNDSLYFGMQMINIKNEITKDTVFFEAAHSKFQIFIQGDYIQTTRAASKYYFKVSNTPAALFFTKKFDPTVATYLPVESEDPTRKLYIYTFNTLKISDNNAVVVDLVEKGSDNVVYSLNLKDYMTENDISVDGKNEQKIDINFILSDLIVTVKPWKDQNLEPGTEK